MKNKSINYWRLPWAYSIHTWSSFRWLFEAKQSIQSSSNTIRIDHKPVYTDVTDQIESQRSLRYCLKLPLVSFQWKNRSQPEAWLIKTESATGPHRTFVIAQGISRAHMWFCSPSVNDSFAYDIPLNGLFSEQRVSHPCPPYSSYGPDPVVIVWWVSQYA